jgi:hypothetical protein
MPINLDTPYDCGELDTTNYPRYEILGYEVNLKSKTLQINAAFLKSVDEEWVQGAAPTKAYLITGDDFDAFIAAHLQIYEDTKVTLYDWIQANDPRIIGTLT